LLTGESGAGKNVFAQQISEWSSRRERPFVVVKCTTPSEALLESELFGHLKGSFTGAIKDKPGPLEAANGRCQYISKEKWRIADCSEIEGLGKRDSMPYLAARYSPIPYGKIISGLTS